MPSASASSPHSHPSVSRRVSEPLAPSTPLARAASGLDSCVHCGFCLPACPTYLAIEDENASPRGRLVLMKAALDGAIALDDPDVATALDTCLGCRACETACPSGVPYGHLLEATRATQRAVRPLPSIARIVLGVFAHPLLLRALLAVARVVRATGLAWIGARLLPGRLATPFALLASTARTATPSYRPKPVDDAVSRGTVTCLTGCVMEGLFTGVNRATERVLTVNGYHVSSTGGQRCCGALHIHAGDPATARTLARQNIVAFEASGTAWIAVNSAGCGAMLKEYGHLLHDDTAWAARASAFAARVRDISELLADAGPRAARGESRRLTYDAPCHLQHAQRIIAPPLAVLNALTDADIVPLAGSDQCCGSAGIYNLLEPAVADAVLSPKLAAIAATGAQVVVTGNPGCLMQIGGGLVRKGTAVVTRHPVELLDAAYARER
jgi:glycolate oxidase iron-sulfur subunit